MSSEAIYSIGTALTAPPDSSPELDSHVWATDEYKEADPEKSTFDLKQRPKDEPLSGLDSETFDWSYSGDEAVHDGWLVQNVNTCSISRTKSDSSLASSMKSSPSAYEFPFARIGSACLNKMRSKSKAKKPFVDQSTSDDLEPTMLTGDITDEPLSSDFTGLTACLDSALYRKMTTLKEAQLDIQARNKDRKGNSSSNNDTQKPIPQRQDLSKSRTSLTSKPVWTTVPKRDNTQAFQLCRSPISTPQPESQEVTRVKNPYIHTSRLVNGEFSIILLHPSPASVVAKHWGAYVSSRMDSLAYEGEVFTARKNQVGPYRSAAVWEFIGQTFLKAERERTVKPKQRRKCRPHAKGLGYAPGISSLLRSVFTAEEAKDLQEQENEIQEEWGKLFDDEEKQNSAPSMGLGIQWA